MEEIDLKFNKKLLDDLWSRLPNEISDMNLKYKDDMSGIIRFNGEDLNSIYVFIEHKEVIIFKFDYVNDQFLFRHFYKIPIEMKSENSWYELRYDSNLNINSKYYRRYDTKGNLRITKINDGGDNVNIEYDFNHKPKEFNKFLQILENNNIIINKNQSNKYCKYFTKGKNIIYLYIKKYMEGYKFA